MNEKTIFTYLFTHFWDILTDSKRSQALKGSFSVLIDNVGHSLSFKLAAGGGLYVQENFIKFNPAFL